MSIVTVQNVDCEFDGNESLSEHSDENDVPLHRKACSFQSSYKNASAIIGFIQSVAHHALRCENVIGKEVTIAVVSENCIKQYNAQFRGRDCATDVLSFSLDVSMKNTSKYFQYSDSFQDTFHTFAKTDFPFSQEIQRYLGDILVCCDYVIHQAREYGEEFERELARVIIHSVLHLLGYKHSSYDMKRDFMLRKQERILASFVFPRIT